MELMGQKGVLLTETDAADTHAFLSKEVQAVLNVLST